MKLKSIMISDLKNTHQNTAKNKNNTETNNYVMMMMNCFCRMFDRRKVFGLISSRDHCQRSSTSLISDTSQAGFEPAQNPS